MDGWRKEVKEGRKERMKEIYEAKQAGRNELII